MKTKLLPEGFISTTTTLCISISLLEFEENGTHSV